MVYFNLGFLFRALAIVHVGYDIVLTKVTAQVSNTTSQKIALTH